MVDVEIVRNKKDSKQAYDIISQALVKKGFEINSHFNEESGCWRIYVDMHSNEGDVRQVAMICDHYDADIFEIMTDIVIEIQGLTVMIDLDRHILFDIISALRAYQFVLDILYLWEYRLDEDKDPVFEI